MDDDFQFNIDNEVFQIFNKSQHFYLIRDLGLSKWSPEILSFRLKEKNLFAPEISTAVNNQWLGV